MAGMIGKIVAQVLVAGFNVGSKAFMQAYRQAVVNAQNGGGAKAAAEAMSSAFTRTMPVDEARLVLNVKKDATMEAITKNFDHLFAANDVKKGGSFYLQSKVYRAKQALDIEAKNASKAAGGGGGGGGAGSGGAAS